MSFMSGMKEGIAVASDLMATGDQIEERKLNNLKKKQDINLKQQEAKRIAETHKQKIEMNTQALQQNRMAVDGMKILHDQMMETKKELNKINGNEIKSGVNSILGSDDPAGALTSFMSKNKGSKALASLQIKSPDSVRIPNGQNKQDREKVIKTLSREGADFSEYTDEEKDNIADTVANSGLYVEVDGEMVNLNNMSIATGSQRAMTPDEKKVYDTKRKTIETAFKTMDETVTERQALADAEKKEKLQKKLEMQAAQVGGKSQLPDNAAVSTGKATYATLVSDYMKQNPNASLDEITDYVMAIKGDDGKTGSGSGSSSKSSSVYNEKKQDLMGMKNPNTGKNYTEAEAGWMAMGGTGSINDANETETRVVAKTMGNMITVDKDYANLGLSNDSKVVEAKFMTSGGGKEKDRREFRETTQATHSVMNTTNEIISSINDGSLNFSVTETFKKKIQANTPEEILNYFEETFGEDNLPLMSNSDFAKRIGIEGKLGLMIAKMTKEYFGGNASNKDRQSFVDAFGFSAWTNNKAVKAKMGGLQDIVYNGYTRKADSLINAGYTYSTSKEVTSVPKPLGANPTKKEPTKKEPTKSKYSGTFKKIGANKPFKSNGQKYTFNKGGELYVAKDGKWTKVEGE